MRIGLAAVMGMALLGGCAQTPPPGGGGPAVSGIAFKISSWGKPLSQWHIAADGSGEWIETLGTGKDFYDAKQVPHPIAADAAHMAELRTILAGAEKAAGAGLKCKQEITDMPYGEVVWTRADGERKLSFNLGCRSTSAEAVYAALATADDKVKSWAGVAK